MIYSILQSVFSSIRDIAVGAFIVALFIANGFFLTWLWEQLGILGDYTDIWGNKD